MKDYLRNGWNHLHWSGSCNLAIAIYKFIPDYRAFVLAWMIGFLWECLDQANKHFELNIWFLDPAGWDLKRDWLVMDLLGIFLAMYLIGG